MEMSVESPPSVGHQISGGQVEALGGGTASEMTPCKCELVNQVRHYNHKSKEFYYHSAIALQNGTADEVAGNVSEPIPQTPPYFDPYRKQVTGSYEAQYQYFQNNEVSLGRMSLSGFQTLLRTYVSSMFRFLA